MTEISADGNLLDATKPEIHSGTSTVAISMLDAFEDRLILSELMCDRIPELEKCESLETVQIVEEPQAIGPPVDQSTTVLPVQPPEPKATLHQLPESKPQWAAGAQCEAVWSEDGKVYAATVLSLEGERCRVRFDGYGNEEDVDVSSLKQPEVLSKSTQEWKAGSRCRAMYSVDGLIYPAVILWVRGQRCRVRFDGYNNEEELDLSCLLSPDELNGPACSGRGATWRPMIGTVDRRRRDGGAKRDPERGDRGARGEQGERGERGRDRPKGRTTSESREEKEADEKKPTERPAYPIFSPFPPFPPPPAPAPHCSGEVPAFVAPPPPFWAFGGKDQDAGLDPTSHMLMLWYMCGFHTGSYLAQQQQQQHKSSSRD